MKIIKADVQLVDSPNGEKILKKLELCGRSAYKSEDKITQDSAEQFIQNILNKGHESVIEHASLTLKFICDRGCYDEQTKVLTANRGWQFFKDLVPEDKFYSLNENNDIEIVKAKNFISYPVKENLIHFRSTQVDLMVTKDHRMWVYDYDKRSPKTRIWKFLPAEELRNNRYKFNKSSNGTNNPDLRYFTIPACEYRHSDISLDDLVFNANDFLWLVGLWITDGSIEWRKSEESTTNTGKLIISQTKDKVRSKLEEKLHSLGISYSSDEKQFILDCPQLRMWLKNEFLHDDDYKKTYYLTLPRWIFNLGKNNLKALLEGIIDGDGTPITNSTGFQVYTASKSFGEDLLELALLVGKTGNLCTVAPRERQFFNGYTSLCKEQYVVSINDKLEHFFNKKTNATSMTEEYYDGIVYCVDLEKNHRLFVQRNGKSVWCGNCSHELVRHRLASYTQESTRYCNYSNDKHGNEITVIRPCFFNDIDHKKVVLNITNPIEERPSLSERELAYRVWFDSCCRAEQNYFGMLNYGCSPQEARSVLPNSLKTEVIMTADLREWRHFLWLRCNLAAHPQMREVALKALHLMHEAIPVVFDDLAGKFL